MSYCIECGKELKDDSINCVYCGATQIQQPLPQTQPQYYTPPPIRHTGFGIAGLVLGIIAVVMSGVIILWIVGLILGILAIIFGAVAFWGKSRDKYGLAGFICGVVAVILAIIWIIITIIYYYNRPYI